MVENERKGERMGAFFYNSNMPSPALAMFAMHQNSMPLGEYMRAAMIVSHQCGIDMNLVKTEEGYRFDFCLHGSQIPTRYVPEWCALIAGSEMFTMFVDPQRPQTIRASFYRMKE